MCCFHLLLLGLHCLNHDVQVIVVRHGCECLFELSLPRLPLQIIHRILRTLRLLFQIYHGFVPLSRVCLRVGDVGSVCLVHKNKVAVVTHSVVGKVPLEDRGPSSLHERHHAERYRRCSLEAGVRTSSS